VKFAIYTILLGGIEGDSLIINRATMMSKSSIKEWHTDECTYSLLHTTLISKSSIIPQL